MLVYRRCIFGFDSLAKLKTVVNYCKNTHDAKNRGALLMRSGGRCSERKTRLLKGCRNTSTTYVVSPTFGNSGEAC